MYKNIKNILKKDEKVLLELRPKIKLLEKADWIFAPLSVLFVLPVMVLTFMISINPGAPIMWRIIMSPISLIFFYIFIGRIIVKSISRLNTYYYVTDTRIIVVRHILKATVKECFVSSVKKIAKNIKRNNTGDLEFFLSSDATSKFANLGFDFMLPKEGQRGRVPIVFYDVENVEDVYKSVYDIRAKVQ